MGLDNPVDRVRAIRRKAIEDGDRGMVRECEFQLDRWGFTYDGEPVAVDESEDLSSMETAVPTDSITRPQSRTRTRTRPPGSTYAAKG